MFIVYQPLVQYHGDKDVYMKTVLVTGGSGMVGRRLTDLLLEKGYKVIWLSRERHVRAEVPRFKWDYRRGEIEEEAVEQADVIIHLAGANLADGPWTRVRKQRIVESRVQTARLLVESVRKRSNKPLVFITASAVGYYGQATGERVMTEVDHATTNDFQSRTCRKWEAEAFRFREELGVRTVALRTAPVLSKDSELLKKMMIPTRFGLGTALGTGKQYLSWIHLDDLCALYIRAIEDETMDGVYNAVAPEFVTNRNFMKTLAHVMRRPFFLPSLPPFLLRMVMGELADMVLYGSAISSRKVMDTGFSFTYDTLEGALQESLEAMKEKSGRGR